MFLLKCYSGRSFPEIFGVASNDIQRTLCSGLELLLERSFNVDLEQYGEKARFKESEVA